jgi:hypothetical protein
VRFRQVISLATITILAILLCGCAGSIPGAVEGEIASQDGNLSPSESLAPGEETEISSGPGPSARIIVTRGFAKPAIVAETAAIGEDTTALDGLQMVASVETKYGGGFVNAINGLSSGYSGGHASEEDWFFYINGISLSTGAGGYTLRNGDCEHWDYHHWGFRQFIPAIIGDYPEPFRHGIGGLVYPTVVTYQDGWEEEARLIADSLEGLGVHNVTYQIFSDLAAGDKEASNLILVGDSEFEPIRELNEIWNRLGFYCQFHDGALAVFDSAGKLAGEYGEGTGLIQATQSIWNPKGTGAGENVVWMISGLDEAGVRTAVDTLTGNYNEFRYACAVVIAGGEIVRVPQ